MKHSPHEAPRSRCELRCGIGWSADIRTLEPKVSNENSAKPNNQFHNICTDSATEVFNKSKASMAIDFETKTTKVTSPRKLAHVVLRTNNFEKMVEFYKIFLGASVTYENAYIAFLTYDEEHHRIAIIAMPGLEGKNAKTSGLDHIAFTFDTLAELLLAYRQRKEQGITPLWPVNHGPTTSIYYQDPDGNRIETQVDNFDDVEQGTEFMKSKYFEENPIGTDFDPDDYIERLKNGASEAELKKRVEIGTRGIPDFF